MLCNEQDWPKNCDEVTRSMFILSSYLESSMMSEDGEFSNEHGVESRYSYTGGQKDAAGSSLQNRLNAMMANRKVHSTFIAQ